MPDATAPVTPPDTTAQLEAKPPLKKGDLVRVECDGFTAENPLTQDDDGGKFVHVLGLGQVARTRLV